jgi:hypothetical protein
LLYLARSLATLRRAISHVLHKGSDEAAAEWKVVNEDKGEPLSFEQLQAMEMEEGEVLVRVLVMPAAQLKLEYRNFRWKAAFCPFSRGAISAAMDGGKCCQVVLR